MEGGKRFRELIDRSFVEEVSESERQLIHDHIRDCDGCKRYLELTARTIRGLREFTFTSEPDSSAQVREILAHLDPHLRRVIRMEGDKRFRELIDRSYAEEVSESERQLIHDHIRDCDGCKRYLDLTARTIRGLREFTFTSEPD